MARRSAPPPKAPTSSWITAAGVLACAAAFLIPLFPDEKISRFKLEAVELSLFALALTLLLRGAVSGLAGRADRGPSVAVAAWLGVSLALALALHANLALGLREVARVGAAALGFLVFAHLGLTNAWTRRFTLAWTAGAALVSVYALLQFSGGAGRLLVPKMERVMGTFGNPIFFSAYLVPSVFVAFAAWRLATGETTRRLVIAAAVLESSALVLTQTRSAYLALAASVVLLALIGGKDRRMKMASIAVLAVAAGGVALLAGRDQAHLLIWRDTAKLWFWKPWTGIGLGTFHLYFPEVAGADLKAKWPSGEFVVNFAHNEYLQTLAEGGVVALAALLVVLSVYKLALKKRANDPVALMLGVGGLSGYFQNLASADFRFGVSHAMGMMLMGLALSRETGKESGVVSLSARARVACALLAASIPFLVWARVSERAGQRLAASAPGFFDLRVREPGRAIADLEARGMEDPNDVEQLAFVYAKEMRRPDGSLDEAMGEKAVVAFRRVIALDPKRTSAYNNLANALFTMGRADEAAPAWKKAADLDPAFVDPRLNLGKTAYVRGHLKEAAGHFQDVLRIEPGNPEAKLYLRRMVE